MFTAPVPSLQSQGLVQMVTFGPYTDNSFSGAKIYTRLPFLAARMSSNLSAHTTPNTQSKGGIVIEEVQVKADVLSGNATVANTYFGICWTADGVAAPTAAQYPVYHPSYNITSEPTNNKPTGTTPTYLAGELMSCKAYNASTNTRGIVAATTRVFSPQRPNDTTRAAGCANVVPAGASLWLYTEADLSSNNDLSGLYITIRFRENVG